MNGPPPGYPGPPVGPPPGPGYPPPNMGYRAPQPTEGKAVTSLVLGLLSIFCFGIFSGIPAVVVGFLSRRDIARSGNTLGGGGMAIGGIVTGALGSIMSLATFGMMIFGMVAAGRAASSFTPPSIPPPMPPVGSAAPVARTVGVVEIVEAHVGAGPLRDQLLDARSSAVMASKSFLVEIRAKWCGATCSSLDAALLDPRMQRALRDVRIFRIDVDDFGSELAGLSMLTQAIPYFYKIDAAATVEESLSADAWDDNTAANMAPVFDDFLRGGGARDAGAAHGGTLGHGKDAGAGAHPHATHSPHARDGGLAL